MAMHSDASVLCSTGSTVVFRDPHNCHVEPRPAHFAPPQVVHRRLPTLPAHALPAAAWVALLEGGVLDAEAYPEKAAAILQGLWSAMRHASPKVGALGWARVCCELTFGMPPPAP